MKLLIALALALFSVQAQAQAYALVGAAVANGATSVNLGGGYNFEKARTDWFEFAGEGSYFSVGEIEGVRLSLVAKHRLAQAPLWTFFVTGSMYLLEATKEETQVQTTTVLTRAEHYGPYTATTKSTVSEVKRKDSASDYGLGFGVTYRASPELFWRLGVDFIPATDATDAFKMFSVGLVQEF